MQAQAVYGDVVDEVLAELAARRQAALAAGVDPGRLLLDPGLGFAKEARAHLGAARRAAAAHGPRTAGRRRVPQGLPRRRCWRTPPAPRDPSPQRDAATAAVTVLAAQAGAWAVRVHEVRASADAVRVVAAAQAASR